MSLSQAELAQYRRDGFLIKRQLVSNQLINDLLASYEDVAQVDPDKSHGFFYYEQSLANPEERILRRIERVSDHSELARKLILCPLILEHAALLVDEPVHLFKDKMNLKLPGAAGFNPHIDGHFYWLDRHGERRRGWAEYGEVFVNVVIPLERSGIENGCLEVSPLEEAKKIFGEGWDTVTSRLAGDRPDILAEDIPKLSFHPLEVEAGDIIFFDWRNPHCSKANFSEQSRRILYATYNPASMGDVRDRYYDDKLHSREPKHKKALL